MTATPPVALDFTGHRASQDRARQPEVRPHTAVGIAIGVNICVGPRRFIEIVRPLGEPAPARTTSRPHAEDSTLGHSPGNGRRMPADHGHALRSAA